MDVAQVPILRKRLALDLEGATVREALATIAARAGIAIWYSDDVLHANAKVHLSAKDITVAAAFTDVLVDADVDIVFARDGSASLVRRPVTLQLPIPDIVRGRVVDDSAHSVTATVMVTRGPDRLTLTTIADSAGNFRVRFDSGTGDYLVYVSALGYVSARRRVQRTSTERELVANFTLAHDLSMLATVKVTAIKPERASNDDVHASQLETGSNEHWAQGVAGQIPPTIAGDLNAFAGLTSNVTITPAGPSILGSGSESNLATLNGMGLTAGSIPRAASTETRVTGATFDATRGGFTGANIDVRLGAGNRDYQDRKAFVTLDPRQLQYSDAVSRALGTTPGGLRGSVGADGEVIRKALTYNVALDVARSASEPSTLVSADAGALLRAGVAPDSVARLLRVATPLGLPVSGVGLPRARERTAISWLGRLDDTRDSLQTRALTSFVGFTREGALGLNPLTAPSAAGERRERTLGAQLTLGAYVGPGKRILTESWLAASAVKSDVEPYRAFPTANVLVRSTMGGATSDITTLTIGGSPLVTHDQRWTAEGATQTLWNAIGKRHRFKAFLWARVDGLQQESATNTFGTYNFNSIADFAAGRASSYTRTLSQPERTGTVWNAATALVHSFVPSKFFSVMYGARVEADGFARAAVQNVALDQALGVRSDVAPGRVHVSPRLGFSYTYNRDRENDQGMAMNNVGRFFRTPTGTLRGGIGEFRDLLRPGLLADASASTGLAGGTSTLSCIGAVVPPPDWPSFGAGVYPTQCLGGSGVLGERVPAVSLIDAAYDVPRSWRSSLDWSANIGSTILHVGGLASYDLNLPGVVDVNFAGAQRFTLANDGNRPMFVSPASIDAGTGAVAASESRRSSRFGSVSSRVSDLRGYGGQLTVGVLPDILKFRNRFGLFTSVDYTLQASKRQYRGFDGAGFGDPRTVEWAPSQNDARHILVVTGGFSTDKIGVVTMFARAQSGLPFTPVVQGDVNGDGRAFDRAFIPDPSRESDPILASQLRSMLASGSPSAQRCLSAYLGREAERNGCRAPWTQSLNVQWRPPVPARWGGRVYPNVYLQNVLAGVDQLVHGSESLRGWGAPAFPDPTLFVPRGFDAPSQRFRYDVNPRFADTRPTRSLAREPFRIVIDFALRLSTEYGLQQLRRAVEPVKTTNGWQRRSSDSITAFYLTGTSSIHKALLEQTDSLFLSAGQIKALQTADSAFAERVIVVFSQLGEFLAKGNGAAGKVEMDSAKTTQKTYWRIFWEQPEIADSIVTPVQKELFPLLRSLLATPPKFREGGQYRFGSSVKMPAKPK